MMEDILNDLAILLSLPKERQKDHFRCSHEKQLIGLKGPPNQCMYGIHIRHLSL